MDVNVPQPPGPCARTPVWDELNTCTQSACCFDVLFVDGLDASAARVSIVRIPLHSPRRRIRDRLPRYYLLLRSSFY